MRCKQAILVKSWDCRLAFDGMAVWRTEAGSGRTILFFGFMPVNRRFLYKLVDETEFPNNFIERSLFQLSIAT